MPTRTIRAADFSAAIRAHLATDTAKMRDAALEAMAFAETAAVAATNRLDLVDRGSFKLSWKHNRIPEGAEVRNDSPYAAVIEHGRRPGRPGPPLEPIREWVRRKLRDKIRAGLKREENRRLSRGELDDEIDRVARAIRKKIHEKGTKPNLILASLEPRIKQVFVREVRRRLRKE